MTKRVEVKKLSPVDIVSESRRTWFVLEYRDVFNIAWSSVHPIEEMRAEALRTVSENAKEIIMYEVLALPHLRADEIQAYISSNTRLTFPKEIGAK